MLKYFREKTPITIGTALLLGIVFFLLPFKIPGYVALVICVIALLSLNPEIGIYLILFSIPFSKKLELGSFLITTMDLALFACFISFALRYFIFKKKVLFRTAITIPFLVLMLLILISWVYADAGYGGLRQFIKFSEIILFFFYSINCVDSKEKLFNSVYFLIALACIIAILRIVYETSGLSHQFLNKLFVKENPLFGNGLSFDNFNLEAAYLNLIVFFPFFFYWSSEKRVERLTMMAVFFIIAGTLFFIFSRGGLLACGAGLLIGIGFGLKHGLFQRRMINILLLLLLVALCVDYVYYRFDYKRGVTKIERTNRMINNILDKEKNRAGAAYVFKRHELARTALKSIAQHPFVGIGPGNYISRSFGPQYLGRDLMPGAHHVHNLYLQIWVEMGSFAFTACIWVLCSYFIFFLGLLDGCKDAVFRPLLLGSLSASVAFSVHNLVDSVFYQHIQISFIYIVAVPFIIERLIRPNSGRTGVI